MKKKTFEFPSAFTVLFVILIIVAGLTYMIPAGKFSKLSYDTATNEFIITDHNDETISEPPTEEVLRKYNINLPLEKFTKGTIKKPMAIPGSYTKIKQHPQGILNIVKAPILGIMESVDIIIFVLIIGGIIGVINKIGAFDAGINALSKKTEGREFLLILFVFILIAIGGTTFGMSEETIAFYPILMPIFLVNGFDAMTCVAAISLGSTIGTMFSTVNPFSVVIASNAAGISFTEGIQFRIITLLLASVITILYIYQYIKKIRKDPAKSLIHDQEKEIRNKFLSNFDKSSKVEFTTRKKLCLVAFTLAFPIMIYGVSVLQWWFGEMSALFLSVAIIIMFLSGLSEKEAVSSFIGGAKELTGVALTVGLARSINIIMDNGLISDTLLYYSSQLVANINSSAFALVQLGIFSVLGFFIQSSSGLAVLSMPIMAPLADTAGVSREIIINAYNWGQGLMSFIAPTGLVLVFLEMVGVTFDKWLKFVMPLFGIMAAFSAVMLIINTLI
ncbi:YfcC family protein [Leptotrichia sp. OH3620_COT-345]|uniref:YfcC family protein n=1 Tax=Leptotrichia sp. OH3620_COT-345 TaxID=2491048 RepID=UPI000F64B9AA|nr:YfcC family protein [Leptotrichia sp. OH3620_COT-345]RRD40933.1 YfcC family protein [Leptotrichia sp. OH3620_COT-345]